MEGAVARMLRLRYVHPDLRFRREDADQWTDRDPACGPQYCSWSVILSFPFIAISLLALTGCESNSHEVLGAVSSHLEQREVSLSELRQADPAAYADLRSAIDAIRPAVSRCVDPYRRSAPKKLMVKLAIERQRTDDNLPLKIADARLDSGHSRTADGLARCVSGVLEGTRWPGLHSDRPFEGLVSFSFCPSPTKPADLSAAR